MTDAGRHIIVGASAAGLSTAEALRRGGFEGELVLVGDEPHLPYDRPPLSKQVLSGAWPPERAQLRPAERIEALGCDWRLGVRADALDVGRRRVALSTGEELAYDAVVIATGVTARHLPFGDDLEGVHVLRTLEDAAGLRADLDRGGPLVVIGAGPLGCETAATARALGLEVDLVDVLEQPMAKQVGADIGGRLAAAHLAHGVRLHLGIGVAGMEGSAGRVQAVTLTDGRRLAADAVLVAIGSRPAIDWLQGSALPLGDGIRCDETLRAAEGVYAAGDVAEWFNPRFGARMRVEHRMNATEQGTVVAANLLGSHRVCDPLPHFWSDQYDIKLQAHGVLPPDATVTIERHGDGDGRFAALFARDGIVQGVLGWNIPRELRHYRDAVGQPLGARAVSA